MIQGAQTSPHSLALLFDTLASYFFIPTDLNPKGTVLAGALTCLPGISKR